jgi:hypothetical protein
MPNIRVANIRSALLTIVTWLNKVLTTNGRVAGVLGALDIIIAVCERERNVRTTAVWSNAFINGACIAVVACKRRPSTSL